MAIRGSKWTQNLSVWLESLDSFYCHRADGNFRWRHRLHCRHLKISSQDIAQVLLTCGQNNEFLFLFIHVTSVKVGGKLPKGDNTIDKREKDKWRAHLLGNPWSKRQRLRWLASPAGRWGGGHQQWPTTVAGLDLPQVSHPPWSCGCSSLLPGLNPISQQLFLLPITKPTSCIPERNFSKLNTFL